jgi:hypothetical protein
MWVSNARIAFEEEMGNLPGAEWRGAAEREGIRKCSADSNFQE